MRHAQVATETSAGRSARARRTAGARGRFRATLTVAVVGGSVVASVGLLGAPTASAQSITSNNSANGVNIAAEGPNHTLKFFWATNGSSTWNPEQVAGKNTTYSEPAIASSTKANGVNIAAEGPNNSLDFYWANNGSATWHVEQVAGKNTTYSAPAIISNDSANGVNIVAEGPNNSLKFYWANNGSATWHAETVAGKSTTYAALSISSNPTGNSVIIAAEGPSNSLKFYYQVQWAGDVAPRDGGREEHHVLGALDHEQQQCERCEHRGRRVEPQARLLLGEQRIGHVAPGGGGRWEHHVLGTHGQ